MSWIQSVCCCYHHRLLHVPTTTNSYNTITRSFTLSPKYSRPLLLLYITTSRSTLFRCCERTNSCITTAQPTLCQPVVSMSNLQQQYRSSLTQPKLLFSTTITTTTTNNNHIITSKHQLSSSPLLFWGVTTPSTTTAIMPQQRTMAVKTNSGRRGRNTAGWFRVQKQKKKPKIASHDVLRGGNIKYDNKIPNTVKLQVCHNEYDTFVVQPDENDHLFYTKAKFTVKDIQDKLNDAYDDFNDKNIIEYFENEDSTWKPLIHINDILKYRGGTIPLKIRLPQYYDDTPLPPNYLDDIFVDKNGKNINHDPCEFFKMNFLGLSIKAMVLLLKHEGYVRSDIKQYVLVRRDVEISTRQYILNRANNDPHLQSLLLNHADALQHMVEYIHYDFVWNKV